MNSWPSATRFTGLRAWWAQRISAIVLLLVTLFLLYSFGTHPLHTYAQWRDWVSRPAITLVFILFFTALLTHMWIGLRDVLLDYARPASVRGTLLAFVVVGLIGLAAWLLFTLLRLLL